MAIELHRSIPACTGEPDIVRCSRLDRMLYPRVCGGTSPSLPDLGM